MTPIHPPRKLDRLSQAVGVLLILVGLGYLALLAFVLTSLPRPAFSFGIKQTQEAREFLLVLGLMLSFGGCLIWIGYSYLRAKT